MATTDYWIDTGRPDLYLAANLDLLDGLRAHDSTEGVAVGAEISPSATVHDSLVSAGARIGDGADIGISG